MDKLQFLVLINRRAEAKGDLIWKHLVTQVTPHYLVNYSNDSQSCKIFVDHILRDSIRSLPLLMIQRVSFPVLEWLGSLPTTDRLLPTHADKEASRLGLIPFIRRNWAYFKHHHHNYCFCTTIVNVSVVKAGSTFRRISVEHKQDVAQKVVHFSTHHIFGTV